MCGILHFCTDVKGKVRINEKDMEQSIYSIARSLCMEEHVCVSLMCIYLEISLTKQSEMNKNAKAHAHVLTTSSFEFIGSYF